MDVFSHYIGWRIPEGKVVKVREKKTGKVLWTMPSGGDAAILEVQKITSDTYAGETTYTGEQFILLDIYPKTNGTVSVTYGGLTKTLTDTSGAEEPNAQQVFFGTFNGVSDEVPTPESGAVTIKGDYAGFGCGFYAQDSLKTNINSSCITAVTDWGDTQKIPDYAFSECTEFIAAPLPSIMQSIGRYAFNMCENLVLEALPSGITSVGERAFYYCRKINITRIPEGVTTIGQSAFEMPSNNGSSPATAMTTMILPESLESIGARAFVWYRSEIGYPSAHSLYFTEITCLAKKPPTFAVVGDEAPETYRLLKITVPKGCAEAYKTAPIWSYYTQRIVEAS